MNIDKRFPSVATMEAAAKRRMPRFIHEYMIGGIGLEDGIQRNIDDLRAVKLLPRYLADPFVYAVAALDKLGGDHVMTLLKAELRSIMGQLGCTILEELPNFLFKQADYLDRD